MPGPTPCPPPGPNHGVPRLAGLLRLVYESARGFPSGPSECDDVIRVRTSAPMSQQKRRAAGYRTREVTDGVRRAPLLRGATQSTGVLEQILGRVDFLF